MNQREEFDYNISNQPIPLVNTYPMIRFGSSYIEVVEKFNYIHYQNLRNKYNETSISVLKAYT